MTHVEIVEYHKWMSKHEMTYVLSPGPRDRMVTMIKVGDKDKLHEIKDVINHFMEIIKPQLAILNFKLILV